MVRISIIIVSWNVREDLVNCLRTVEENHPKEEFEVIVVDNASSDGTIDLLKGDFSHVILLSNRENRGFAAANNQGIKIANGDYIFLLNPDTIVHPGALDELVKTLDENPTIGACGPRILDANGRTCSSIGYVPTFRCLLYRETFLRSLGIFRGHYKKRTAHKVSPDTQADVEQLSGAAFMVRRSVLEEIGLMDERFFMYYEDVDLCLRIRDAGWRIVFVPESVITHIGGKSAAQIDAAKQAVLYSSLLTYFRKHRGKFQTSIFSLVFKPGVIAKNIANIFVRTVALLISVLSLNPKRQAKSRAKIKRAAIFLTRYSGQFLFKA